MKASGYFFKITALRKLYTANAMLSEGMMELGGLQKQGFVLTYNGEVLCSGTREEVGAFIKEIFKKSKSDLVTTLDEILLNLKQTYLRQEYINAISKIKDEVEALRKLGKLLKDIAEKAFTLRRELTIKYKHITPDDLLELILKFNEKRYTQTGLGDQWGLTWEGVIKKYGGDYEKIIQQASTPLGDEQQLGAALFKVLGEEALPVLEKYKMTELIK